MAERERSKRGKSRTWWWLVALPAGWFLLLTVGPFPLPWVFYDVNFEAAAKTQMQNFGQAINNYRLTNEALPPSLDVLTETDGENPHPYIDSIPADPWGSDYDYEVLDAEHYVIRSNGEDGLADTPDDIVYPDRDD